MKIWGITVIQQKGPASYQGPGAEMILASLGTDKRFCLPSSTGEEGTMPSRQAPWVSQNDVGYLEVSMLEYTARRQAGHTD